MKPNINNPETLAEVARLHAEGKGATEIGKAVGLSDKTIRLIRKKLGLSTDHLPKGGVPATVYLETERVCDECNILKPIEAFRKRDMKKPAGGRRIGYDKNCLDCAPKVRLRKLGENKISQVVELLKTMSTRQVAEAADITRQDIKLICTEYRISLDRRNNNIKQNKTQLECYECHEIKDASLFGQKKCHIRDGYQYETLEDWCLDCREKERVRQKTIIPEKPIEITEEIEKTILDLRSRGWGDRRIGDEVGLSRNIIRVYYKSQGISGKPPKPVITEKKCKECKHTKPIEEFPWMAGKKGKGYRAGKCNDCFDFIASALKNSLSSAIRFIIEDNGGLKGGKSILKYLPYTMAELKHHIRSLFEPWMTWENWGLYDVNTWDDANTNTWTWQIDHIIPKSDLPFTSMEEPNFLKSWGLQNLRPLSAKQNVIEGSTRTRHASKKKREYRWKNKALE